MKVSDLVFGLMASHDKEVYSFEDLRYLISPFNISEPVLRTNLSRMSASKVIQINRDGRNAFYHFGDKGQRIKANVIHGFTALDWDGWDYAYWGVIFSVPDAHSENRHYIRKKLTKYRFACLYPGFWIRPVHPNETITKTLDNLLSSGFCRLIRFYNHSEFSAAQISDMWNLQILNQRFQTGLTLLDESMQKLHSLSPQMSLVEKMTVGDAIVSIIFDDPMLPRKFLPQNWYGDLIRDKFRYFDSLATACSKPYTDKIF